MQRSSSSWVPYELVASCGHGRWHLLDPCSTRTLRWGSAVTTFRIVRRRSLTGTETFKVQRKMLFWWKDVVGLVANGEMAATRTVIWFHSIHDARHWISLQEEGCDLVVETVKALR